MYTGKKKNKCKESRRSVRAVLCVDVISHLGSAVSGGE